VTQAGLRETREIPEGSVCVVCIGSTIGKTGITTCRSATNQQINSIICKSNHPEFVYYLMTIHSSMVKSEAGTQAVPIINKSSFSALLVQVPPYEEQLKISSAISTVDSSISDVSSKLGALLDIKKALMQDLLTGKVRVNVNQEEAATA
jgi:type I restriction enzyme S subunit